MILNQGMSNKCLTFFLLQNLACSNVGMNQTLNIWRVSTSLVDVDKQPVSLREVINAGGALFVAQPQLGSGIIELWITLRRV